MTTGTMIAPDNQITDEYTLRDLTSADRCDRCPSQAYVRVELSSGLELTFCGHHYAKHEPALASVVLRARDERARLLESYKEVDATELTEA